MRALERAAAVALLGLATAACDHPPVAGYVTEPVPPATRDAPRRGREEAVEVAEGTATGFIFLVDDPGAASGDETADEARSTDERIARVLPASSSATVRVGGPSRTGRVFVVVGAAAGEAEIEVSRGGAHAGRLGVRVLSQDP